MSEEKTEIKGENEAGASPEKPVIKGEEEAEIRPEKPVINEGHEASISDAKTEKRGGVEVAGGPEKEEIKGENEAGTSEENSEEKGEEEAGSIPDEPAKKVGNADAVILFRLRKNLKQNLQEEAKGRGITLTELILSRVKGSKVRDRKNEEKIISVIEDFTREFNQIGNNINQIAVAIHQIKNEHRIEGGQFAEIANALEVYNERIETLRSSIHKIESDDI